MIIYSIVQVDGNGTRLLCIVLRGDSGQVKLKYYLRYMACASDDSPLYIFDSSFGDHAVKKGLLDDFEVCPCPCAPASRTPPLPFAALTCPLPP